MQADNEIAGMNAENFSDFIQHPANLYRVNYQELKGLVLQYPNALNLRILLLLKSKMDNHPDFEKNLRAASVYAVDRRRLYDLLQNPALQLKQLENIRFDGEAITVDIPKPEIEEKADQPETEAPAGNKVEKVEEYSWLEEPVENLEAIAGNTGLSETPEEIKKEVLPTEVHQPESLPAGIFDKYLQHLGGFYGGFLGSLQVAGALEGEKIDEEVNPDLQAREPEQMKNLKKLLKHKGGEENQEAIPSKPQKGVENPEKSKIQPLPKEAFQSWQQKEEYFEIEFDALEQIVFDAVKKEENRKKAHSEEKSEAEILAKRSLKLKTGIVSETLAELLVKQENYEQAIEMYEQLILKYPEKSAFFALQIENLKKL